MKLQRNTFDGLERSFTSAAFVPLFLFLTFSVAMLSLPVTPPVQAAPPRAASAVPRALSFRVTGRFSTRGAGASQPQQLLEARVFLSGRRARIESRTGKRPVVFLFTPPHLYKLLPRSRAGVRWNFSGRQAQVGNFNIETLLRNPQTIRATLQKQGARRSGTAKINGVVTDIYALRNFMGKTGNNGRVWLRRSDALPLRLEATSRSLSSVISWRDYKRNPVPATLFQPPAGYSIRNSTSTAPSLL